MKYALMILGLAIGFILIVKGGDIFVESSVSLARIAHIKEMIIGATIVSVGTTLPEFFSSLIATIRGVSLGGDTGYYSLALANAIGSMLCNSGLVLALVMLIRPPRYERSTFNISTIYVLLISLFIVIAVSTGSRISVGEGVILLLLFVMFMMSNVRRAMESEESSLESMLTPDTEHEPRWRMVLSFIVGGTAISVGAMLLVDNAKALAMSAGISEQLLGVTLVAVGTSLPELVTALTSLRRGNTDVGVGNILGAHVINGTLIIGVIAVITSGGLVVDAITRNVAVYVMLAIMSVLIVPTLITRRFARWQGIAMLAIYIGYIGYNIITVLCI